MGLTSIPSSKLLTPVIEWTVTLPISLFSTSQIYASVHCLSFIAFCISAVDESGLNDRKSLPFTSLIKVCESAKNSLPFLRSIARSMSCRSK